jgi:hypothetical protein
MFTGFVKPVIVNDYKERKRRNYIKPGKPGSPKK